MARPIAKLRAILPALILVLAACSSGEPNGSDAKRDGGVGAPARTFIHVHGLSVGNDGTLYVATHGGLIKQAGDEWVYASRDRNDHMGFSLHPQTGTMYRSGHPTTGGSLGVETSSDGASWNHLTNVLDPPVDFHAMTVSLADENILYGWDSGGRGTFRSTDGGKTWKKIDAKPLTAGANVLHASSRPNELLAGVPGGLFRSPNGGSTWTRLVAEGVLAVATNPRDPKHMMISTEKGLRVSRDDGKTWAPATSGIPVDAQVTSLSISPLDSNIAYAAVATTLFQTKDGGTSWSILRSES